MRSATKIGVSALFVAGLLLAVQASAIIFPCDYWCKPYKSCYTLCDEGTCGDYGCCLGNTWNCDPGVAARSASPATPASPAPRPWLPAAKSACDPGIFSVPADPAH